VAAERFCTRGTSRKFNLPPTFEYLIDMKRTEEEEERESRQLLNNFEI